MAWHRRRAVDRLRVDGREKGAQCRVARRLAHDGARGARDARLFGPPRAVGVGLARASVPRGDAARRRVQAVPVRAGVRLLVDGGLEVRAVARRAAAAGGRAEMVERGGEGSAVALFLREGVHADDAQERPHVAVVVEEVAVAAGPPVRAHDFPVRVDFLDVDAAAPVDGEVGRQERESAQPRRRGVGALVRGLRAEEVAACQEQRGRQRSLDVWPDGRLPEVLRVDPARARARDGRRRVPRQRGWGVAADELEAVVEDRRRRGLRVAVGKVREEFAGPVDAGRI